MFVIAQTRDKTQPLGEPIRWLRCANRYSGSVVKQRRHKSWRPAAGYARRSHGEEAIAWGEVRACLSVGATTAAVMMCRKLLFHTAVAFGLPPKNNKDRAPTFEQTLEHLQAEGVITKHMRSWAGAAGCLSDLISQATHDDGNRLEGQKEPPRRVTSPPPARPCNLRPRGLAGGTVLASCSILFREVQGAVWK
jgi:hypothetical protein